MTKCLLGAVAAAVVLGTITAASSADIRVGFINPTGPPAFWNQVNATMTAAASQLGIDVDIRETERSRDKAIAFAKEFASQRPALDYLIATNDVDAGGEIIKIADAAHLNLIFLNNDLEKKDWVEYGEPRTKYKSWLGSITPDHEGAGYDIATTILTEAAHHKNNRPLRVLALTGDARHRQPGASQRAEARHRRDDQAARPRFS